MIDNEGICLHNMMRLAVEQQGDDVMFDRRLYGTLLDMGGVSVRRFATVIQASLDDSIAEKLLNIRSFDEDDWELKIDTLKQTFREDNFFDEDIADYIIDCYLFTMAMISEPEPYVQRERKSNEGVLTFEPNNEGGYCGLRNGDGERSGFGIQRRHEGSFYAGEWKLNMRTGTGLGVGIDRARYAGEWRMNRKNGAGVQIAVDGRRYVGEWKNDKRQGLGIVIEPNGRKSVFQFIGDKLATGAAVISKEDGTQDIGVQNSDGTMRCPYLHIERNGDITVIQD